MDRFFIFLCSGSEIGSGSSGTRRTLRLVRSPPLLRCLRKFAFHAEPGLGLQATEQDQPPLPPPAAAAAANVWQPEQLDGSGQQRFTAQFQPEKSNSARNDPIPLRRIGGPFAPSTRDAGLVRRIRLVRSRLPRPLPSRIKL